VPSFGVSKVPFSLCFIFYFPSASAPVKNSLKVLGFLEK